MVLLPSAVLGSLCPPSRSLAVRGPDGERVQKGGEHMEGIDYCVATAISNQRNGPHSGL